jgi:ribosomal protein L32
MAKDKMQQEETALMNDQDGERCPRCGEGRLRRFDQLSEEEREVARRLPASADYASGERQTMHRWCTKCWYEETRMDSINT